MTITTSIAYSDIDIELSQANDGDVLRDVNEEAIINSITNIIYTIRGSRRMLPDFSAGMHKLLFEPMTDETAAIIRDRLMDNIYKWDDRVIVEVIYIDPQYDSNMYKCLLTFRIKGFPEERAPITIRFVIRRD
jgi:uncharacterized protein